MNANIFLKADRKSLQLSEWPPEIRSDPSILDKCKHCSTRDHRSI